MDRQAFNKYNPDDLLAQLVDILDKHELVEVSAEVRKITPKIQQAWRSREASASNVAGRWLDDQKDQT
jgi:hypothetical protein